MAAQLPNQIFDQYIENARTAGFPIAWFIEVLAENCPEPILRWAIIVNTETPQSVDVIVDIQGAISIEKVDTIDDGFSYIQGNITVPEYDVAFEEGVYDGSGIPIGYRPGIHTYMTPLTGNVDSHLIERNVLFNIDDTDPLPPPST